MWAWILLIAVIILLNSFALGKVYKHFNIYLSSYSCFTFGIITLFGLFGFILIPLLLFTITLNTVLIIYLIAQCLLILVYVINWRWLFISYKIDLKKVLIFALVFITVFCGFIITRDYISISVGENRWLIDGNIDHLLKFANPNVDLVEVFVFGQNYFENNFIYIFMALFVSIFNISDLATLNIFYTYIFLLVFMILTSTTITSIFVAKGTKINVYRVFIVLITALLISTISFSIPNFMWIVVFTILLVNTHSLRENELSSNVAIYIINFIVVAGIVFDINFLIVAIVINLIHTFLSFQARKEKCTNYNILTLFSTFLVMAMSFSNEYYVGFICFILIIIIYTFYLFYKSSNVANRVNSVIDNFLYEYIHFIMIFIISILVIASISFFLTNGTFTIATDVWLIKTLANSNTSLDPNSTQFIYINCIYLITNVATFLLALTNSGMIKLNKFGKVFRLRDEKRIVSSQFNLTIFVVLVFWNPISTNLYTHLVNTNIIGFVTNFQVIFAAMFVPCLLSTSKHFYNSEKISITGCSYMSIILAITALFALGINLV